MIAALLCLVVGISDGDTLTARCPTQDAAHPHQQVKVRLAGVDAPERRQSYGERSRQHLAGLCFKEQARISVRTTDRYGRSVADVECRGQDAGQAQVQAGLAWYYARYGKDYEALAGLESEARQARRGLWSAEAVPPWEWRKRPQNQHQPVTITGPVGKNSEKSGIGTKLNRLSTVSTGVLT